MTRNNVKCKLEFIQDATVYFKTTGLHLICMINLFFSRIITRWLQHIPVDSRLISIPLRKVGQQRMRKILHTSSRKGIYWSKDQLYTCTVCQQRQWEAAPPHPRCVTQRMVIRAECVSKNTGLSCSIFFSNKCPENLGWELDSSIQR